jgi:hypothetical protein
MTSPLQTSLLLNTVQSAGRKIIARFAGNSDATRLARVLELAMTSSCCNQVPAIGLQQPEDVTDLHARRIAGRSWPGRKAALCDAQRLT